MESSQAREDRTLAEAYFTDYTFIKTTQRLTTNAQTYAKNTQASGGSQQYISPSKTISILL